MAKGYANLPALRDAVRAAVVQLAEEHGLSGVDVRIELQPQEASRARRELLIEYREMSPEEQYETQRCLEKIN